MQKYRVTINGQNLLREIDGVPKRLGFYTAVFVEASTPADAEVRAIDILQDDAHLRDVALNVANDPVRFDVTEVQEIETIDDVTLPRIGLALYEEDAEDREDASPEE